MKIIHATWEKHSLNVDCNEIIIEITDTLDDVKDSISKFETEYTVIKVPSVMTDISLYIQSQSYIFMEAMTSCFNKGSVPHLSRTQNKIVNSVSYSKMNLNEKEYLFDQIRDNLFKDDRVSVDINFTKEESNNRYINWISDELENGSILYKLKYKSDFIGFFLLKKTEKNFYFSLLGGVFLEYQNFGFGICLNYFAILEGLKQNAKRIYTSFSSNNKSAYSLHLALGFELSSHDYVFIKHKNVTLDKFKNL